MNTTPESSEHPASSGDPSARSGGWRKVVWVLCSIALMTATLPLGLALSFQLAQGSAVDSDHDRGLMWVGPVLGALLLFLLLSPGLNRAWFRRTPAWLVLLLAIGGAVVADRWTFHQIIMHAKRMTAFSTLRQLSAGIDGFFLEHPGRMFVAYDEIVGADKFVKETNPVAGEDYRDIFPVRRSVFEGNAPIAEPAVLSISLSEGPPLEYYASDIAGRELPDGVNKIVIADGRRIETTYRHGRREGPFRAYFANGRPWSAAEFRGDRVVGPAWLFTPGGLKFDEADPTGASQAFANAVETESASRKKAALAKLAGGDPAAAIAELDSALELRARVSADLSLDDETAGTFELHRMRAEVRRKTGDWDGAIADYVAANPATKKWGLGNGAPLSPELRDALFARARARLAKGDKAGASADGSVVISECLGEGNRLVGIGDYAGALPLLSLWCELAPSVENYQFLAEIHLRAGNALDAEAEYDRALELLAQGKAGTARMARFGPGAFHFARGYARRLAGKAEAAIADFRTAAQLWDEPARSSFALIWAYVTECEVGRKDAAGREFAALDKSGWLESDRAVAAFLLGQTPQLPVPEGQTPLANQYAQFTAAFYRATRARLAGDSGVARKEYQAALATAVPTERYDFNLEEAKRKGKELLGPPVKQE